MTNEYKTDFVTDRTLHAGRVKRYHTWAVHHQQTVGEHCWQVARIYESIFGALNGRVERYIRHHDTTEVVVGDPPFPVKANSPVLKAEYTRLDDAAFLQLGLNPPVVSEQEKVQVKICDLVEMMEFGMVEREMGNLLAVPIVIRTERVARAMADKLPSEQTGRFGLYVSKLWERHELILQTGDNSFQYNYRNRNRL